MELMAKKSSFTDLFIILALLALVLGGVAAAAATTTSPDGWVAATATAAAATAAAMGDGQGGSGGMGASWAADWLHKLAGWPAPAPAPRSPLLGPAMPPAPRAAPRLAAAGGDDDGSLPPAGVLSLFDLGSGSTIDQQRWQPQEQRRQRQRQLLARYNRWKNGIVLAPLLPAAARARLPHAAATWARNALLGCLLYALPGLAWAARRAAAAAAAAKAPQKPWPRAGAVRAQVADSLRAVPLVALLPTAAELAGEAGWTRAYVGAPRSFLACAAAALLYQFLAEWAVYWVHRAMHASPWLYKNVHSAHHRHGRDAATLSPFAGMAFSWVDGAAHAAPYALLLLVVPMHWLVYEALVVASSWWTASTHDDTHAGIPGVLSARYHSLHHRMGRVNYGQYTQLFDRVHGTLCVPEELRRAGARE